MVQDDNIQYDSINAIRKFLSGNGLKAKTQRFSMLVEWESDVENINKTVTDVLFLLQHDGWYVQIDELSDMHYEYAAYTNTRFARMMVDEENRLVIRDYHPKCGNYMVRISIL